MSKTVKIAAAALVALIVVGGAGMWWFLRDDEPDAVSLDSAVEAVATTDASGETTPNDADPAERIAGTWTVDSTSGEFDFESATGTFAGFRINENLSTIGQTEAVGRTGDVSGTITIEGSTLTEAEFEVDLTTITTTESRRDSKVQDALETSEFPLATFTLTEPVDLPEDASSGADLAIDAVGNLTIHGVTTPVTFPLEAKLVGDTVVVVGSLDLTFADYGVEVPTAPVIISVDDFGVLEIQVLLTKG